MQLLHPPSIITGFVYGLLILNAGAIRIQETTGLVCDGINSSEACDSGNENIARAIDAENDKRSPSTTNDILPRAPQQKPLVNCDLLLSKPAVQCTGLKKRTCNLLTWLYAGCTKARECADKTGVEAKKCCDNRDVLPFGGGTYYTGYMRACAPQYDLKRLDRPVFTRMECPKLESFTCEYWMGRHYCDLRDWERAGCRRQNECKDAKEGLASCCASRPTLPKDHFSKFFLSRYNATCTASAGRSLRLMRRTELASLESF